MENTQATLLEGWGYWDVTNYPYGGCFRRAAEDTPVTVIEKHPKGLKIQFADGRKGVADVRALAR